jgi:TolB-like protein/Tfp pilus assembly protein PilF
MPATPEKDFAGPLICASRGFDLSLTIASGQVALLRGKVQFLFADHTLDVGRRELLRGSAPIAVAPQVFDLLVHLVRNRERVVSKDDLIASVWGGRIVSESTLASRINAVRKAIGDSGEDQRLIRTLQRKGVRFVGAVRVQSGEEQAFLNAPKNGHAEPARPALPLPDRPAIAVLPFTNMSDNPEQEYFSDGISEDIIAALSKLRWFFVIARNSSFTYKGKSVHMKQIAEELGVSYVVEGSVRRSGDRVRITAQLNDAAAGNQLWAERYDRGLADVFKAQDEITEAIVAAIEPQLYAAENFHAQRKPPESLDAWALVMRALSHFWRMSREDHAAAQALLEQAIAVDPNYAQALAVLAVSRGFGMHVGWEDRATAAPAAEREALAAVRADSEDPWARFAMASVYRNWRRFDEALAEYEAALSLNPNFALAQGSYGLVLTYVGRWQEGSNAARRALRLSPRDPFAAIFNGIAAYAEFVGGNYNEAMRLAREGILQRPDFVGNYRQLTASAAMAGDLELARASLQDLRRVQPSISLAWLAEHLPLRPGQREFFLEALRRAGMD